MFDPEMNLSDRLAKELGLKNGLFYSKQENAEEELKYLILGGSSVYSRIRNTIHDKPTRLVDTNEWTRNGFALVTLNFDTKDQLLARNGYSLRIRFALTKDFSGFQVKSIDMCIKTIMPTGKNVVLFKQTRGEWECELHNLQPSMARMIAANLDADPVFPNFFKSGLIKDEDLFIESIGCSLRNVFPSYEIIRRHGLVMAAAFQHTEDVRNVFLTPYGDAVTGRDSEAEAEFTGIHGIQMGDITPAQFEKMKRKSMELLDRTIVSASPREITRNLLSKAVRARNALEINYGPDHGTVLRNNFNLQQRIDEASRFSLSQGVTAADINLEIFWNQIGHLRAEVEREAAPQGNPFQYGKRPA